MNEPVRLLDAAKRLHAGGRREAAARAYRQFLDKHPASAEGWYLLGAVHLQSNCIADSIAASARATELDGQHAGALSNLGMALRRAGRSSEGAAALRRAVNLEPDNPDMHYSLGVSLAEAARPRNALDAFKHALRLSPGRPGALLGVGHCHRALGRQELAYKAYRTCLAVRPESAEAWWSIANLKLREFDGNDLETIAYVTSRPDLSDRDRALMHYVQAKALEDARRFDEAFTHYVFGAAIQRRLAPYDPRGDIRLLEETERVFNRDAFARAAAARKPDVTPIFVVGLPRSGSTLVERILTSHSLVGGGGELPHFAQVVGETVRQDRDGLRAMLDMGSVQLSRAAEKYLTRIPAAPGETFVVDKQLNNFLVLGAVPLLFPNAKIIDVRRHPTDSCVGAFTQYFARGQEFSYDLGQLGEYCLRYDRFMRHWRGVLGAAITTVWYEDLVTDQKLQTERLLKHCGLEFETACLEFHRNERAVHSASSEQVRQPMYTTSMQRWRRFENHLGGLQRTLAPLLESLPDSVRK